MTEAQWEERAQQRLMNIVTRARNGQQYKHLLKPLATALQKAPKVKAAVAEALRTVGT